MNVLRQSTASQTRSIGSFVDDTDFKSVENGLTIADTDIKLKKNGATAVNKNSGGATSDVNGMYALTFDATDTNTVGELEVSVDVSGALVVWKTFFVLEEAVFDLYYVAAADGEVVLQGVTHTGAVIPTVSVLTGHTPQTADHTAAIADIPTVSEFNARTIASANYALEATLGIPAGASISVDIADLPTVSEFNARTIVSANYALEATLGALNDFDVTAQLTESYAADGVAPTTAQALFLIQQIVSERDVTGTVLTIKEIDGSTTAATFALDSATVPTNQTRSS